MVLVVIKPIRIKMMCNWCSSKDLCEEFSNMCNRSKFSWNHIEMTWNDNNIDYYVIINSPQAGDYYEEKKTFIFQMEPWVFDPQKHHGVKTWGYWSKPPSTFLHINSHDKYLNGVQWWVKDFDQLNKTSDSISCICSFKNFDIGHILRNNFIRYAENTIKMEIMGKENYHQFNSYIGKLYQNDKASGLCKYKYHFACENNSEKNYATEKIWDPLLCECLCFYWGCPNLEEYINPLAFVRLDLNDFEGSLQVIAKAIEEDLWSQRIDIIRSEKNKILNKLGFFPNLNNLINLNKR